jgi:hypothetical protein
MLAMFSGIGAILVVAVLVAGVYDLWLGKDGWLR